MNPPPDTSAATTGSKTGFWVTFLAILGCFVIFLVVLYLAYIPQRRTAPEVDLARIPPEEQWKYTPGGRQAHFTEMRAREAAAATSYAWIDKEKGVVRLPIDRAMELTLRELNDGRKQ
jgi:hypothetical protein